TARIASKPAFDLARLILWLMFGLQCDPISTPSFLFIGRRSGQRVICARHDSQINLSRAETHERRRRCHWWVRQMAVMQADDPHGSGAGLISKSAKVRGAWPPPPPCGP